MTLKEILELVATILTICVSFLVLWGAVAAHKRGFFKALHHVVKHHYEKITETQHPSPKGKKRKF